MTIEQHVTNLELSKKLKEVGVKQRGCFDWVVNPSTNEAFIFQLKLDGEGELVGENKYIAFLASELLMMLPSRICKHSYVFYLTIIKETEEKVESSYYCHQKTQEHGLYASYGSPANSLANLILTSVLDLHCVTIDEINARIL
jgi:hypothetical protein